jgi:Arc/MetJ-type ribon-helix-helix transcriptional regulator
VKGGASLRVSPDAPQAELVRECVMTRYTPGPEADAIVDRLLATGHFNSADEVVRAGLELLRKHDVEVDELLRLGDARIAAGRIPPRRWWRRDDR